MKYAAAVRLLRDCATTDQTWAQRHSSILRSLEHEMFGDNGFMGNTCSSDYDVFFEQAVSMIDTACDELVPEG